MIAFLTGRVAARTAHSAVIDVNGVGMTALCTPATLGALRVGDTATIATSLVVREDSLTLYGFADDDERAVFERLQTASGVGPRLALAMLAVHTPEALRKAVATEDTAALTAVPGIGRKGASRIVLELRDKLGEPFPAPADVPAAAGAAPAHWRPQVVAGLTGLGWSARDAEAAADAVAPDAGADADVGALLRAALRRLSKV